jgi:hypothetical protein
MKQEVGMYEPTDYGPGVGQQPQNEIENHEKSADKYREAGHTGQKVTDAL